MQAPIQLGQHKTGRTFPRVAGDGWRVAGGRWREAGEG